MNQRIHYNMSADAPLADRLEAKRAEIRNYERILAENSHSRWFDQGRRHLAQLNNELVDLEGLALKASAD